MELDELTKDLFFPKCYFFFEPRTGNRARRTVLLRLFQHFLRTNDIQFTPTHQPGEVRTWFLCWCELSDIRDKVPTVQYTEEISCDTILLSFYVPNKNGRLTMDRMRCLWWNREIGFMFLKGIPDSEKRFNAGMDFYHKLASKKTK